MKEATRILYNAYVNTYALLEHRGYQPAEGSEMVPIGKFRELELSWQDDTKDIWLVFERDDDFIDVSFPGKVDKKLSTSICQYVCSGGSRGDPSRNTHVIIVVSEGGGDLADLKKQSFTREKYKMHNRVEIFKVVQMQINPLLHSRQPPFIQMITDEDEKEELRSRLVAAAGNKDAPLEDILPIMYLENPLAVWYDAYVGDVFYFIRHDGLPYFRIVKPDPQIDVGAKTKSQ